MGKIMFNDIEYGGGGGTSSEAIASIESITTASKAYAIDDLLFYNNTLYKVTAPIAQGETITTSGVSANVTQTDVDTELKNKIKLSSTAGLMKNDGTVDTNTYTPNSTFNNFKQTTEDTLGYTCYNLFGKSFTEEIKNDLQLMRSSNLSTGTHGYSVSRFKNPAGSATFSSSKFYLDAGTYKLSGCPSGGSLSSYYLRALTGNTLGTQTTILATDTGNGDIFTLSNKTRLWLEIGVNSVNISSNTINFDPMIAKSSYNGDYVDGGNVLDRIEMAGKNKANLTTLANNFSTNSNYLVGNLVIYNEKLYRCIVAHPSNTPWDSSHFSSTTVSAAISYKANTADISSREAIANAFDSTASYAVGDYVTYGYLNNLYKCTTAHTGDWDSSHFVQVNIGDELAAIPAVSVAMAGTASASTVRKQQITVGNSTYDIFGTAYMEQDVALSTSDSTIATFTNAAITTDSDIEVSVSDWSCVPENVSAATGTCAVTLPKVDTAATVRVRIYIR